IIIFGWVGGVEKGWKIAHEGAEMRIPDIFKVIIKYITPAFLVAIFVMFTLKNVFGWNFSLGAAEFNPTGYVQDLVGEKPNHVARLSVGLIVIMTIFSLLLVNIAGKVWAKRDIIEKENH
ncbi:MAG TPA: sodium:calcium symporter, partial [Opitutaceae bacterium]|nr:sodium:calcium symporter [Opitutaceae bacterium]